MSSEVIHAKPAVNNTNTVTTIATTNNRLGSGSPSREQTLPTTLYKDLGSIPHFPPLGLGKVS